MELVTPDPEWEQAVAHILGDLLVVERYENGAALVRKGASFPMVSLDGEVFSPSGTVSGGRMRVTAGAIERRTRIAASEENLRALKKRITELSRLLSAEEATERSSAVEKEDCSRRIRDLKKEAEEKKRDLALETAKKERLREEYAAGGADIEAWQARRASLEVEMETLEASVLPPQDAGEISGLPSRLVEIEASFALLEERLSSVRALRQRTADECARGEGRRRSLDEEERSSSIRGREERERLSHWGKAQYRIFLDLRAKNGELDCLRERERMLAARSVRISARSKAAVERAGTTRRKTDSLVQQLGNLAEERERLIEAWEEQHPYDRNAAPGADEGEAIAAAVRRLERDLRVLAPVDWGALSEDNSLAERVAFLQAQLSDVHAAMDELRSIIEETDRHVGIVFNNALANINSRFDALFRRLFGGGESRIQLLVPQMPGSPEDLSADEGRFLRNRSERRNGAGNAPAASAAWDQGVEIVARPPGKHLQNLAQLSGGEQTLTAIAYLFASMEVAGVPLAVLDEVDAALDESNLIRFGELAREYACPSESAHTCGGIQLLVMTHRRATMERADILYGVTLAEPGLSKVVGIKVDDWVETPPVPLRTYKEPVAYARREQP
jgi:chromosome segregation protein